MSRQGLRFWRIYTDERRRTPTGNCLGVERHEGDTTHRGVGPTTDEADSEVGPTSIPETFLRERCKRISTARAREEHPRLALFLDDEDDYVPATVDRWQISEGAY